MSLLVFCTYIYSILISGHVLKGVWTSCFLFFFRLLFDSTYVLINSGKSKVQFGGISGMIFVRLNSKYKMVENRVSRSPGSFNFCVSSLCCCQRRTWVISVFFSCYFNIVFPIKLLAFGGVSVEWLPWSRGWDTFETLCFMAVWLLLVALETSAFQCHDICKRTNTHKREHLIKTSFYSIDWNPFFDTGPFICRPLGGDMCVCAERQREQWK